MAFITELEQISLRFVWRNTRPQIAKQSWERRTKLELPHSGVQATTKQQLSNHYVLAWKQTHRSMEQNKEPQDKPMLIWSINLQQSRQAYTMGKDSLFNKWCQKNCTAVCNRINLDYFLTPHTKINSKAD